MRNERACGEQPEVMKRIDRSQRRTEEAIGRSMTHQPQVPLMFQDLELPPISDPAQAIDSKFVGAFRRRFSGTSTFGT